MPPVLSVVTLEQTTPALPVDSSVPPIAVDTAQQQTPTDQNPPLTPTTPIVPASPQTPPTVTGGTEQSPEGDVLVTGRSRRGDPLEPFNAASFEAAQAVDKAVVGPAAMAYEKGVPSPLRSGLRNFLVNLREPVVFFNFLLQHKIGKAAQTAGRFLLNSTVGILGVMDVAKRKPFNLPLRRNSFANTLGFYGVGTGPFFFLPLVGPTTLRDLVGTVMDQVLIPIQPIRPSGGLTYTVPVGLLSALDYRARIEPDLQRQRETGDPYAALRREYLARRKAEIDWLRGRGPEPDANRPRTPSAAAVVPATPPATIAAPAR
jgi:phospholipid-binding lipoprotein MlaA